MSIRDKILNVNPNMASHELIPLLQTAVGPVILISAVGLLLLTMNNRLSHAIDRIRTMSKEFKAAVEEEKPGIRAQIDVLWERTRLLQHAIELASLSALCASLLIIVLFLSEMMGLHDAWLISLLFILALAALFGSLTMLILDVHRSLIALKLELVGNDSA